MIISKHPEVQGCAPDQSQAGDAVAREGITHNRECCWVGTPSVCCEAPREQMPPGEGQQWVPGQGGHPGTHGNTTPCIPLLHSDHQRSPGTWQGLQSRSWEGSYEGWVELDPVLTLLGTSFHACPCMTGAPSLLPAGEGTVHWCYLLWKRAAGQQQGHCLHRTVEGDRPCLGFFRLVQAQKGSLPSCMSFSKDTLARRRWSL